MDSPREVPNWDTRDIILFQLRCMASIFLSTIDVLHPCREYDAAPFQGSDELRITSSIMLTSAASCRALMSSIAALVCSHEMSLHSMIIGTTRSSRNEFKGIASKCRLPLRISV